MTQECLCINGGMFMTVIFVIVSNWKLYHPPTPPLQLLFRKMMGQITLRYVHPMGYHITKGGNDLQLYVTILVNLKHVIVNPKDNA